MSAVAVCCKDVTTDIPKLLKAVDPSQILEVSESRDACVNADSCPSVAAHIHWSTLEKWVAGGSRFLFLAIAAKGAVLGCHFITATLPPPLQGAGNPLLPGIFKHSTAEVTVGRV